MNKVRHVLGISGGKDSAALAAYLKMKYPLLDIDYYSCDTGKELDETYKLIERLEIFLGKKINVLRGAGGSDLPPFDHFLAMYGGYLPSSNARWCTSKLKLEPFEQYVGNDPVVSYVGIRGDEDREGYISKKPNIQSIFPFRQNIWSEDVILKFLSNSNLDQTISYIDVVELEDKKERFKELLSRKVEPSFTIKNKITQLLNLGTKETNRLIFQFLKTTNYPLSNEEIFPLVENEEILVREDIFRILKETDVGIPAYYTEKDFSIEGKSGQYARSRSGCYFCFFQQKIEWVWLYEQHPELFRKAMEYEKDGYSWNQHETLEELIKPERINQIKKDYLKRQQKVKSQKSSLLSDILEDAESEGCAACFI